MTRPATASAGRDGRQDWGTALQSTPALFGGGVGQPGGSTLTTGGTPG